MFSSPEHRSPQGIFSKIFSLKQISPSSMDKLTLLVGKGNSFSKKRSTNVELSFNLRDPYRLLKMKNLHRGRTTSRKATPLGDPRGVPKEFSTFLCFSKHFPKRFTKHISKSLPIRLEGFRNRIKHSSQSVIQRIEVDNSVNILVLKTRSKDIKIQLNLNIDSMENTEHPLLGHLFDLIESTDFTFSGDEGPTVDLNELWSSLPSDIPDNSNTVSSSQHSESDDFLFPDIQSTLVDSSGIVVQEDIFIDPAQSPAAQPHTTHPISTPVLTAPLQVPPPQFTVTAPAHSQQAPLPQIFIQIPGTDQYQLIQIELETPQAGDTISPSNNFQLLSPALPTQSSPMSSSPAHATLSLSPSPSPIVNSVSSHSSSQSSDSPSSASPSSSSSSLSPPSSSSSAMPDDYSEMRRKNNIACEHYRNRRKTKQELADEELKSLEEKNEMLNMRVRTMESIIKDLRAKVITNITEPRMLKRGRNSEDDDNDQPENKRSRWEQ